MILWFCDSDSAYKCLMVFLVQRRTRLTTVKTGLRTRPNFAYKLWRFSFDCTFSLVDSHRHQKVQKQCCHLDCIHISGFSSTGAVCKTRGMLTTIIFLVQRKPFFFFFLHKTKGMFQTIFFADSRHLTKIITVCHTVLHGLFKVSHQSTCYFCKNTYMKTLLKPEECIILNNLFINQQ